MNYLPGVWQSDMRDCKQLRRNGTQLIYNPRPTILTATMLQGKGAKMAMLPLSEVLNPNLLMRDFLQERWKGLVPILWGRQLKQERLSQLIYMSLMNAGNLPDSELSSPVTDFYRFDTTPGPYEPEPEHK